MISETFLPVHPAVVCLSSALLPFFGKTVLPNGNTVYFLSFITYLFNFILDCIKVLVHAIECHVPVVHSNSDIVKIL